MDRIDRIKTESISLFFILSILSILFESHFHKLNLYRKLFQPYAQFRFLLLALSITLSSCTTQSPAEQVKDALRTERSWAATLQLMGESWQQGAVTNAYMRKALESAGEELQKEADSFKKLSGVAEEDRGKLVERAVSLKQLALEMREAVVRQDHSGVGQQLERLKAEEEAIQRGFAESVGESVP